MAIRKKTVEVEVPVPTDPLGEARALLRRLAEDSALRDALSGIVADAEQAVEKQKKALGKQKKALRKRTKKVKKRALKAAKQAQSSRAVGRPGIGKLAVLGVLGAAGAAGVSPALRSKLLDALFGAEEEFEYTPPVAPGPDAAPGLSAV